MNRAVMAAVCAGLLAAACGGERGGAGAGMALEERAAPAPVPFTLRSSGGHYLVKFTPRPEDFPPNELFSLQVQVLEAEGNRPAGADVELLVDAGMPAHRHGMTTRAQVTPRGAGRFTVEGMLLHMAGDWLVTFDMTRGAMTERAQVDVEIE